MEEEILDKKILGAVEEVEIVVDRPNQKRIETNGKRIPDKNSTMLEQVFDEKRYKILTKIDTGAWRSSVSFEIAKELGLEKKGEETWVRSSLGEGLRIAAPLTFYLAGEKIETEVFLADRSKMQYKMIVGRRDLKNFIVDPSKNIHKTPLY